MENNQMESMKSLTQEEIHNVSGGVIFIPAAYAAFVSGAKWGRVSVWQR